MASILSYCACFFTLIYSVCKKGSCKIQLPFCIRFTFSKIELLYGYRERINGNTGTALGNMQQQIVNVH